MFSGFKQFFNAIRLNCSLQHFTHTGVHLRYVRGIAFCELEKDRTHRTVEVDVVFILIRQLLAGTTEIKGLLHSLNRSHKSCLQFFGQLNVFNGPIQAVKLLCRGATEVIVAIEVMEHLTENF